MKCKRCPNEALPEKMHCKKCNKKSSDRKYQKKLKRKCISCHEILKLDIWGELCEKCKKCKICSKIIDAKIPNKLCNECKIKNQKKIKNETKNKRKNNGLCIICGKMNDTKNLNCKECYKIINKRDNFYRKNQLLKGLCTKCDEPLLKGTSYCLIHYIKQKTYSHFGSCKRWQELLDLFNEQNICPYTKKQLTIGLDASLDHKMPKSKGGSNEISNLQWVYHKVNYMKRNLLESEFLNLIQLVYKNIPNN